MVSTEVAMHVEARRERTVGPSGSSEMSPQMVVGQDRVGGFGNLSGGIGNLSGGIGNLSGKPNSMLFENMGWPQMDLRNKANVRVPRNTILRIDFYWVSCVSEVHGGWGGL